MEAQEKAAAMIRERGYDRAVWHAQIQKRGSTDDTGRAYWERVIDAMKAQGIGNAATAAYELDADLPDGEE